MGQATGVDQAAAWDDMEPMESVVDEPNFALDPREAGALRQHIGEFSEMLVRDFLRGRGLDETLATLDAESASHGARAPTMESWKSMASLLGLVELMQANADAPGGGYPSILEVLAKELVRETNIKMRRPVTMTVLHGAPSCAEQRSASLAQLTRTGPGPGDDPRSSLPRSGRPDSRKKDREARKPALPPPPTLGPGELAGGASTLHKSLGKINRPAGLRSAPRVVAAHSRVKLSRENWIPMDCRERMLQRDLSVTKSNIELMVSRKNFVETDKLHHRLSELEQNQTEERYGIKKKKRCGLCHLEYSLINLVLSVPFKAVQDLRNTWAEEFQTHPAHVKACARTHKAFTYDQVGVCVLCSQFFQLGQQDMYRPSYEKKVAEKCRKVKKENEAAAKRYWDPVKQLEDDRRRFKSNSAAPSESGVRVPPAPLAERT